MIACAYCDNVCIPTREHLIPDWYCQIDPDGREVFNARNPIGHTKGDMTIRDTCEDCNCGPLASLDDYGKQLYQQFFANIVYAGESVILAAQRTKLIRWMLKLSFNSARVHHADTEILSQYRGVMLGVEAPPDNIRFFVGLIAPSYLGADGRAAPSLRTFSADAIEVPVWFRLVQMRMLPNDSSSICVQRQVYINSYCFTLIVPVWGDAESEALATRLATSFHVKCPHAVYWEPDAASVQLSPGRDHVLSSFADHMDHYPGRYGSNDEMARTMHEQNPQSVIFPIAREDIETGAFEEYCGSLWHCVPTRERAMLFRQRLIFMVLGYDEDQRELRDIPEVQHFFQRLFQECPFLFILAHPQGNVVRLLAECHCSTGKVRDHGVEIDLSLLKKFFEQGFQGMNDVAYRLAISDEDNRDMTEAVMAVFHRSAINE